MAIQGEHFTSGQTVSPFIGGALPSAPRMGGQQPSANLFSSGKGFGGTTVGGAQIGTPGQTAAKFSAPTMDHVVKTAEGHIDNGVKSVGDGFGGIVDGAAGLGQTAAIGAYALTSAGVQSAVAGLTVSQSFQWPQAPEPAPQNTGHDAAYLQLAFAMDQKTKAKLSGFDVGDFNAGDLGNFQAASVPDVRQNGQSAGMAIG